MTLARRVVIISFLSALVVTGQVLSISVVTLNVSEMIKASARVFYGKCIDVEENFERNSGVPVLVYRFQVLEGIKGVVTGEVIEVRQLNSRVGSGVGVAGLPVYEKGQEIMLFLHGESRLGLTSPVGMSQGVFGTRKLTDGGLGLVNGVRNGNLLSGLDSVEAEEVGLTDYEIQQLASGAPIPVGFFRDVVIKIDRVQRERREVDVR